MLVLSRKRSERIIIGPDQRAEQLAALLARIDAIVRDPEFLGELQQLVAEALPLAQSLAVDSITITAVRMTHLTAKLGLDVARQRTIVREELSAERRVPA